MNANELRVLAISKGRYEVLENNVRTNTYDEAVCRMNTLFFSLTQLSFLAAIVISCWDP